MSGTKKIEEGIEHVKNAEKSLKTSLLKWRPDYENAADEYNKAATCFRNAKAFEQCKDSLLKAVECHKQNRGIFYAAKALDQCILICKELGDLREISSLAERAANMYQSHGSGDAAASSLEKAAKILESSHPAESLKLFQHAMEIVLIQDNSRQAAEFSSKVARLHVKLQQFDLAADAIRRELGIHQQNGAVQATGRLAVALVLVQLARGDVVAAEKAFKEWGNYCDGPEAQNLETLLQAYDEEDPETAKRALNDPFIKHMDVEYAILARKIALPKGLDISAKQSANEDAASHEGEASSSPNEEAGADSKTGNTENTTEHVISTAEDDEEYSGGLC